MNEKRCTKCGKTKTVREFYKDKSKKSGYASWCKECHNTYKRDWYKNNIDHARRIVNRSNYRRGVSKQLGTNPHCASYLGVYVAERVLWHVFEHVERMPYGNQRFDFICGRGYKIDVKSACRYRQKENWSDQWAFHIDKNTAADYFMCLAFDDREDLNPEHVWVLPASLVNDKIHVSISESTLQKWSRHELHDKLEKIIGCCNTLRGETSDK